MKVCSKLHSSNQILLSSCRNKYFLVNLRGFTFSEETACRIDRCQSADSRLLPIVLWDVRMVSWGWSRLGLETACHLLV